MLMIQPQARRTKSRSRWGVERQSGAHPAPLPVLPQAQLATLVSQPPAGEGWLHEIKYDGYRMFCRVDRERVRFLSRNGQDWTARLQPLVEEVSRRAWGQVLLDGEVVVVDQQGISRFQRLQSALGDAGAQGGLCYFAFDLLHLDGFDLTALSLERRKLLLAQLLQSGRNTPAGGASRLHLSEHIIGSGAEFHRQACRAGLEGIISKRREAPYVAGRRPSWLKIKCRQGQELVVGGYTPPGGSRIGFGALLMGYYGADGQLHYAGRVGTGFSASMLRELTRRLKSLAQDASPFSRLPRGMGRRDVRWVRPELVAHVEFTNWTEEGLLRQASFAGLREDKSARNVRRETPATSRRR